MTPCTRCGGTGLPDAPARQRALLLCPNCSGAGSTPDPLLPYVAPTRPRITTQALAKILQRDGLTWRQTSTRWKVSWQRYDRIRDDLAAAGTWPRDQPELRTRPAGDNPVQTV